MDAPTLKANRHLTSAMLSAGISLFPHLSKWSLPLPVTHPDTWTAFSLCSPLPFVSTSCPLHTRDARLTWPRRSSSPPSCSVVPAHHFSTPNTTPSKMLRLTQGKSPGPCPGPQAFGVPVPDVHVSPSLYQGQCENPRQRFLPSLLPSLLPFLFTQL